MTSFLDVLQKASKRGMSVRKSKKSREYTSMKSIGIKSVDETFKVCSIGCKARVTPSEGEGDLDLN